MGNIIFLGNASEMIALRACFFATEPITIETPPTEGGDSPDTHNRVSNERSLDNSKLGVLST